MAASRSVTRCTRLCIARCMAWRVITTLSQRRHRGENRRLALAGSESHGDVEIGRFVPSRLDLDGDLLRDRKRQDREPEKRRQIGRGLYGTGLFGRPDAEPRRQRLERAFSGRTRTAFRWDPDSVPEARGQRSGDTRTAFRTDPDTVPGVAGQRSETIS
jgi:hypothetical protein